MLLSKVFTFFEMDKRLEGYSPYTLKSYKIQFNLLLRYFGDVTLDTITYEQLKAFLYKDAERLKPASLGHRVKSIRSLFRWATDNGYVPANPSAKLREPKQGMRIPKAMTEEDIELLRESCETKREHAIVEFLFTTGCRLNEVVSVNRDDVNWGNRSLVIRGKGDKEREVYFTPKCEIWLKWYLAERADNNPALFVTDRKFKDNDCDEEHAPRRLSDYQIRHIIKQVAQRGGVQVNVYPHRLRHSYAMHLLDNGAPLEVIQSMLGHTKSDTTRIYAVLRGERRRELYRKYF